MEVTRYIQSTKNRKLVIFLQYIKKKVLQLLLCSIVMQNIQIVYGGPATFIVTCFLAQPDRRNFPPQRSNTIIKQQLCGEGLPSFLSLLQLMFFKKSMVYCSKSTYALQTSQQKACIRHFDTNSSTQIFTRIYNHTETESLYHLDDEKIS